VRHQGCTPLHALAPAEGTAGWAPGSDE